MTIPGLGASTAMVLKAEIGDIRRFEDNKSLYNDAGLVPLTRQPTTSAAAGLRTRALSTCAG